MSRREDGDLEPPALARRFGAAARLYGAAAMARFAGSAIAVVGIGGVGTWAAEALARCGVGRLTLVDLDHVSESNANRQIHALDGEFGRAKVAAMAQRVRAINPAADVREIEEFVAPANAADLLAGVELVVDCADQVAAKAAMALLAREGRFALVTCGAAGGRRDPLRVRRDDLARAEGDPLLAKLRRLLRAQHGFAARGGARLAPPFGIDAVFSDEPVAMACAQEGTAPGSPLACGGYGSSVVVTATMGMCAAGCALERLAGARGA